MVIPKIASEFASALLTTGGASISCGNCLTACETLSRTSLAASSKFASKLNYTVILLVPKLLADEMERMPAIPLIDFSNGSVICDSIISALAPV